MIVLKEVLDLSDVQTITEAAEDGKKSYFIQGPFLQAEMRNRNGRWYPKHILEREVNRYVKDYINENRGLGELGHPDTPSINLHLVSHMIKELKESGNDFIGKAKVLDTPNGMIVQNLIKEGVKLGVSSRGCGSLVEDRNGKTVQEDYVLSTPADIVADPSAPAAFVNAVMENANWVFTDRGWQIAEKMQASVKKMTIRELEAKALPMFEAYLRGISKI